MASHHRVIALALALTACASGAAPSEASVSPASAPAKQDPAASPAPAEAAKPTPPGADFIAEARFLARLVPCAGDMALPKRIDAKLVETHCAQMRAEIDEYRRSWVDVAMPFIAGIVPKGLPDKVVYPFGGGDLLSALATYPDANEYTTISLEPAADIRKVDTVPAEELPRELARYRSHLAKLFEKAHSRTDNLGINSHSDIPGQIVFSLAALEVHGYEATSLRYFHIQPDGSLKYLEQGEIAGEVAKAKAKGKDPDEVVFGNMELQFRKKGAAATDAVKVLRHIVFNLEDYPLKTDPSLIKHLESKGKVAAMTKAATHLLWSDHFSIIRNYLLTHADFMISDSTGVPPRYAKAAGFVQDTYGIFTGPAPFGTPGKKDTDELVALFKANPQVELPFRYGYPDAAHHGHIVVTRRP